MNEREQSEQARPTSSNEQIIRVADTVDFEQLNVRVQKFLDKNFETGASLNDEEINLVYGDTTGMDPYYKVNILIVN